jgi:hypothetical protein
MEVNLAELDKIPYYQNKPTDGRAAAVFPFWENGEFRVPFPHPRKKEIVIMKPDALLRGAYLSKQAADATVDFCIPLADLVVQRLSFPGLLKISDTITNDILNFGAVLEKYDIIHSALKKNVTGIQDPTFLIATELEFLFENLRSLYDQLQLIIKSVWGKTLLSEPGLKKQELSEKFSRVVFFGQDDRILSAEEITTRYGLPSPLATFYYEQANFFKLCREIRNNVTHHGASPSDGPIYHLINGFAVDVTMYPYSGFNCWKSETLQNEKLGSVRALIAYIALQAINATSIYANTLQSCITLPEPIAAGWHLYVRNAYVPHIHRLEEYIRQPWNNAGS